METISQACQFIIISVIKLYQYIVSPLLGPRCRYYPSCSSYAITAFRSHGVLRGFYLTLKRILRCHPFAKGGVDLVPDACGHKKHLSKG